MKADLIEENGKKLGLREYPGLRLPCISEELTYLPKKIKPNLRRIENGRRRIRNN